MSSLQYARIYHEGAAKRAVPYSDSMDLLNPFSNTSAYVKPGSLPKAPLGGDTDRSKSRITRNPRRNHWKTA